MVYLVRFSFQTCSYIIATQQSALISLFEGAKPFKIIIKIELNKSCYVYRYTVKTKTRNLGKLKQKSKVIH